MPEAYDHIGTGYTRHRRADPRIAQRIAGALGDAATVLNVGAGTGSYEPADRLVLAVEPSATMIRQRLPGTAPVVRAHADALPVRDATFDASLAVLTVHHWKDAGAGLDELTRAARRRTVLLTWDPDHPGFWLTDYFPEILEIDRRIFPAISRIRHALGRVTVAPVPIPHDCVDGFLGAYWRRPRAYLDPAVRRGMSTFHRVRKLDEGLHRLAADLDSGEFDRRYGAGLRAADMDLGYRIVSRAA